MLRSRTGSAACSVTRRGHRAPPLLGAVLATVLACGAEGPPAPRGGEEVTAPTSAAPAPPPADAGGTPDAVRSGPRTAFVHLFEWRWDDVARECELFLGPSGYAAVQVSPPQEHAELPSHPWWERYQPVSYALESRSGGRAACAAMVSRCNAAGVDIYVDAVLNHMSFLESGTGSAGTPFTRYGYPGLYDPTHFHGCRRPIEDWSSRVEIQSCDLATCPDLDTGQEHVRARLAAYLQDLVDLGVAGIRVDAAKHIALEELGDILGRVKGPLFVYQEVIDHDGNGPITAAEYLATGSVTEFRYGADLSRVLRSGKLAWLESFGTPWGFLPGAAGIAFVDNHDNQRGHGSGDPLTHRERPLYELSVVFMLAWPWGYPQIMSSYEFVGGDDGPPSAADGKTLPSLDAAGACAPGWVCEHRWPRVSSMVGFRNATSASLTVTDWWTDGEQQIAFGRGDRGFVVVNRSAESLERTLTTSMGAGTYCDVLSGAPRPDGSCDGTRVEVHPDGTLVVSVAPLSALAIHAGSLVSSRAGP
jgi:alpha-amylase